MRLTAATLITLLCALVVACSGAAATNAPVASVAAGRPTVVLSSPPPGATVTVGAEVAVLATAADNVGVARLDLSVDGVSVDTYTSPSPSGQPSVAAELHWTPRTAGAHALSVTAFRADGTASDPIVMAVSAVDVTGSATPIVPQPTPIGGTQSTTAPATAAPPTESPTQAPTETPTTAPTDTPAPTATPTPTLPPTPKPTRRPTPPPTPTPPPANIDLRLATVQVVGITDANGNSFNEVDVLFKNEGTDPSGPIQVQATCQGVTKIVRIAGVGPDTYGSAGIDFAPTDKGTNTDSRVVLDPHNRIKETDETNNSGPIDSTSCDIPV